MTIQYIIGYNLLVERRPLSPIDTNQRPPSQELDSYAVTIGLIRFQQAILPLVTLLCLYGTFNTGRPIEATATAISAFTSMLAFSLGERSVHSLREQRRLAEIQSAEPSAIAQGYPRPISTRAAALSAPEY